MPKAKPTQYAGCERLAVVGQFLGTDQAAAAQAEIAIAPTPWTTVAHRR